MKHFYALTGGIMDLRDRFKCSDPTSLSLAKYFRQLILKQLHFAKARFSLTGYLLVFSKSNQQWGRGGGFIKVALMQGQGPIIKETTR